jgi:hypothetical protein
MNFCIKGGYLLDGETPLATDPIDHDTVAALPIHGCNRLRCSMCGALARSAKLDVRASVGRVDPRELRALYELPDLASSPLLESREKTRLYLCRCNTISVSRFPRELDDHDYPEVVPWRCDGHPVAVLPHVFDGAEVRPDNVAALAEDSLRARWPADAFRDDLRGGFWATRLHTRLEGTPWQGEVVRAALAVLADPDASHLERSRALHFFDLLRLPEGAERAVELLAGDRAGFAGVRDAFTTIGRGDRTLEMTLWRVAAPLVARPGRARDLARADALAPGKGSKALYFALAEGDPEWLAENLEAVARSSPKGVEDLGYIIPRHLPSPVAEQLLDRLRAPGGK